MVFRSCDLPGIGTKYELDTAHRDTLAIVYMETGRIQLYTLPAGSTESSVAELTAMEARRLGNVLTGAVMETDEEGVEIAFSALADLRISVHTYLIKQSCVGSSIGDLAVRSRTGATIVAVSRAGKNTINPDPAFIFKKGDVLVVIGEAHQLRTFETEILGK
jgi:TrkA domain protein